MREVVDGVFEIRHAGVNVHLIVTDDGLVLIDTGWPGQLAPIERALRELGREPGDVRAILLTHHHADHAGGAAELRERTGAPLFAHAAAAPFVNGSLEQARPTGRLARFLSRPTAPVPVTKLDRLIGDGAEPVPGLTAVHTPGHTRGHLSFVLDRAGGVLFAGDAAGSRRGRVTGPHPLFTEDRERVAGSIARLAERGFEHAVFGHGDPITGRAATRFGEA